MFSKSDAIICYICYLVPLWLRFVISFLKGQSNVHPD